MTIYIHSFVHLQQPLHGGQGIPGTLGMGWNMLIGCQFRTGHTHIHTFVQFSIANIPTGMFLQGRRKPGNPEETRGHRENIHNSTQTVTRFQD